jgi:hypothetical protein
MILQCRSRRIIHNYCFCALTALARAVAMTRLCIVNTGNDPGAGARSGAAQQRGAVPPRRRRLSQVGERRRGRASSLFLARVGRRESPLSSFDFLSAAPWQQQQQQQQQQHAWRRVATYDGATAAATASAAAACSDRQCAAAAAAAAARTSGTLTIHSCAARFRVSGRAQARRWLCCSLLRPTTAFHVSLIFMVFSVTNQGCIKLLRFIYYYFNEKKYLCIHTRAQTDFPVTLSVF